MKGLRFTPSSNALGRALRRAGGAHAALALHEREPGGEDGEGREGAIIERWSLWTQQCGGVGLLEMRSALADPRAA